MFMYNKDMDYKEYKNKIIQNMPDFNYHGMWKGSIKKHILGNPKTQIEKVDIINKYSILPNVMPIDSETLHLHTHAHHLNSSQIMCYNFFRPIIGEYDKSIKMYQNSELLSLLIERLIKKPISTNNSHDCYCNFEYIESSKENTNFDFYFKSTNTEVFFEIKYSEQYFSRKSSSKKASEQYEKVYRPMINNAKDMINIEAINEYNFNNKYYQLFRNAIRANRNRYVLFVCPKAHNFLINQFNDFSDNFLSKDGKERIMLITWEKIIEVAKTLNIRTEYFEKRYLEFL